MTNIIEFADGHNPHALHEVEAYLSRHFCLEYTWRTRRTLFCRLNSRFPGITVERVTTALELMVRDLQEVYKVFVEDATFCATIKECEEKFRLFEGTSPDTTFTQAIANKASKGDPVALKWQTIVNSKKYRRYHALLRAACRANPHCIEDPDDGSFEWDFETGDRPSEDDMIEWFKTTYPTEARRIEDAIEGQDTHQS
jgi:hypothetical protein